MLRRETNQYKEILAVIKSGKKHFTTQEIFLKINEVNPKISLGTVYRNVNKWLKTAL